MSAKDINTVGHVHYVNIVQFQKSIRILLDFLSGLGLQKNVFHDRHLSISTGSFIKVLITLQTIIHEGRTAVHHYNSTYHDLCRSDIIYRL